MVKTITNLDFNSHRWDNFHGNMWDRNYPDGYPEGADSNYGWWTLTKTDSHYNYVVHGPTGGGKTGFAVYLAMCNAVIPGKPVYSNLPFHYFIRDIYGTLYLIRNLELDIAKFIAGDSTYWNSWVLIDEGNFTIDQRKFMSNMNLGITDIIQEGRKMGISLIFTTINATWLDPRFTGSLLDVAVKCRDLYFTTFASAHELKKGIVSWWDFKDISGKYTGTEGAYLDSRPFFYRNIWNTFNTQFFINPLQARRSLKFRRDTLVLGADGQEYKQSDWLSSLRGQLIDLKEINGGILKHDDLWDTLGIPDAGRRVEAGKAMRKWGVIKKGSRDGDRYDLRRLQEVS